MTQSINRAQQAVLDAMRCASFNEFNGDRVVDDLIQNRDLWISCFWTMYATPLAPLRALHDDFYNGDTLYILTTLDRVEALEQLAEQWEVDEFRVVSEGYGGTDPEELKEVEEWLGTRIRDLIETPLDAPLCIVVMWWD